MTARATQRQRIAELTTPLGADKLLLTGFHAEETLSTTFEIAVDCLSHDPNIDFNAVIGKGCSIRLNSVSSKKRYFHGILTDAAWTGQRESEFSYRLTLRPWLWLLSQTTDCRIFQNLSVIDIIKKVFDHYGFRDYEVKTNESYPSLDYCVQYRESALNFVQRLMERFGIYYYFKHSDDKHLLVLADSRSSHNPIPDLPQCRFIGLGERTRDNEESVNYWTIARSFQSGKVTLNGFDFNEPNSSLIHAESSPGGYTHDSLEIYDYPEKYKKPQRDDLGKKLAEARLFAAQARDHRRQAQGDAPSLFPGGLTTIIKHPVSAENTEFLVVSASHSFQGEGFRAGGGDGGGYSGRYVLQPSTRPFKAPMVTPHPVISGPQTAIVVGSKGEEIHTDKFGRIKVKFHWDRYAPGDDRSSRWVRVAQTWSGKAWGGVVLPRVGMEVVIEFIEGDPDRPLVIGTVYNGENGVPFTLPANKTQSGVKSRSTKEATDTRYNELVFEDKKDVEFVRFHAEKDLMSTIEDKESRTVKGKNKTGPGDVVRETTIEKGDDVLTVTGDHKSTINRHQVLTVADNRTVDIGKNETIVISDDQTVTVGKNIVISAGDSIVLKVGDSSITLKKTSITIKSGDISVRADGKINLKSGLEMNLKGSKISQN